MMLRIGFKLNERGEVFCESDRLLREGNGAAVSVRQASNDIHCVLA